MVAYLKKPTGSEGFQEIVNFLNGSHIRFALIKNPTIYVSLIEKFWQTATVRTVDNGEQEIIATFDGKEFTITEAFVRRHLQLADVEVGMTSGKGLPTTTASLDFRVVVHRCQKSLWGIPSSGNIPKSPTMPHGLPLPGGYTPGNDEGKLKQTKQTYGAALTKLIKKVKKLEQTVKTSQARRRAKIVVSDDEERISLVTPTKVSSQEDQSEDQLGVLSAAKVLADAAKKNVNTYTRRRRAVSTGSEGVSTASRIFSTAEESVSTAGASMPVSTAGMVQQVNIIIPSSSETTKDKGKAIMQESEQPKKIKKRVQIQMSLDEELAQKLHEEEQARFNAEQEAKFNAEQEELLASETTEDEANPLVTDIDWDDVQAQIQIDEDLAQKLLEEEMENLSIEERARLLAELIDKRKKLQAAQ
ncbi:hypothetical protein Tco_0745518 [Tanacetum coccineum]